MLKKIAMIGTSAALLAAVAVPMFARERGHREDHNSQQQQTMPSFGLDVIYNSNDATVVTTSGAEAYTGGNVQNDNLSGSGLVNRSGDSLRTGSATAFSGSTSVVNKNQNTINESGDCGCDDISLNGIVTMNRANVRTESAAGAYTDMNTQNDNLSSTSSRHHHSSGMTVNASGDTLVTGNAYSDSTAGSWVNVNLNRIR